MTTTSVLFLLSVAIVGSSNALQHDCIHDKVTRWSAEWRERTLALGDADNEAVVGDRKKRQVRAKPSVDVPATYTPIRIKLDYTFLNPDVDRDGLCLTVGQWVRIGAATGSNATHSPVCSNGCDAVGKKCDCWFQCTQDDIFYAQKRSTLVDVLFPAAVERLQRSYQVLRTPLNVAQTPLPDAQAFDDGAACRERATCHECTYKPDGRAAARQCAWCKSEDGRTVSCRDTDTAVDGFCPAARVLKKTGDWCEDCGCSGEQVPMSRSLIEQYTDYTEHDMVLFVTAHSTRLLSGQTLAYACSCRSNILGRPTFGHINWGSNKIDFRQGDHIDLQVGVAVHEMTHALVFSSANFEGFLDTTQSAQFVGRTVPGNFTYPRLAKADVVRSERVTATGLQNKQVSKQVTTLRTPRVLEKARAHFGCDSLAGVELEDAGSSGTAGSHWEKRIFNNEYMTGSSAFDPVYSDVTMALFEDSGWYRVNYSAAQRFYYGEKEGCDFVRPRCDKFAGPYACTPAQRGFWGCTFDYRARGVCSVLQYTGALPDWNQYFAGNATAGGNELPDFCPFYSYSANLESYCTDPRYQADNLAIRGEHFSESSRCLDSTLLSNTKQGLKGSGACYALRCVRGKLFALIAKKYVDCSSPGAEKTAAGYTGRVKCPPAALAAEFCKDAPQVDSLPTVTKISPSGGARPMPGDRFDITGTGLASAANVTIGDAYCTKLIGQPTDTRVVCEVVVAPSSAPTSPPTPAPTTNIIDTITDIFTTGRKPRTAIDVVVELQNGVTAFYDGYVVSAATSICVSSSTLLLLLLALLFN